MFKNHKQLLIDLQETQLEFWSGF